MGNDVQLLVDSIAIRELTARYNRAGDDLDVEGLVGCFVPDGVLEVHNAVTIVGHDAIRRSVARAPWGPVHITADAEITITGDTAHQICTLAMARRRRDGKAASLVTTGRTTDDLVRTPDGWRFAHRRIALDLSSELTFQSYWD